MNRSEIEKHLNSRKYAKALDGLTSRPPSTWRDTSELKCLRALGRGSTALQHAKRLYHTELDENDPRLNDPDLTDQLRYIALVFAEQGEAGRACVIMRALCKKKPKRADLRREYAFVLSRDVQLDGAEQELINAARLQPDYASCYGQLARLYCRTGRVEAGLNCYYRAASIEPDNPDYLQWLAYWGIYTNHQDQQSNYRIAHLWASKAHPDCHRQSTSALGAEPARPLKIAFVSADLCAHAISFFIVPLLKQLDRSEFQVGAYSDTRSPDSVTAEIKAECDFWRDSAKQSDAELAKQIEIDKVDVLVDMTGHCLRNRMGVFSRRTAALQISWLGYPSTTGLKSIDYRITDQIADPESSEDRYFSEQQIRLKNGFLCYQPLPTAPDIQPRPENKKIMLGSFNSLAKISNRTLDAWAAALHTVPDSSLYLKCAHFLSATARNHLIEQFKYRGISADRLVLKIAKAKIEEHLDEYNKIDIALDTTPYNGATTTLEALWMGVPVVSLSGNTHASRVSASILDRIGMNRYAVPSISSFADRVAFLTENYELRKQFRHNLRVKMQQSSLMNSRQFANEFGNAVRQKWRAVGEPK